MLHAAPRGSSEWYRAGTCAYSENRLSPTFDANRHLQPPMIEPQIVDSPALTFIGYDAVFRHALSEETNNFEIIPPLWHRFGGKGDAIPNRIEPDCTWGVIVEDPPTQRSHSDELRYLAGAKVSSETEVPEGMVVRQLPASKYARFTLNGPINRIGKHCEVMYRQWLPASVWEHAGVADLERYDERFCAESEDSVIEYWISIRPKS